MFYALGNFVPRRESAWALIHERTSLLADRCTIAAADPNAPKGVRQAQHRATALAALLATYPPPYRPPDPTGSLA
jgi:hypothetical protein